ncbi:MAG TPA: NotI family restriction endonuclease [Anaerolineae bacterium]|nr:NotI family restriction endonuclease [Anaerolineae bacterium]
MQRHPAEVFGYPVDIHTREAAQCRTNHWCPFLDQQCDKKSRLIDYPMGVCSVEYEGDVVALCPNRFLQKKTVFRDIAAHHFGGLDNLVVFNEVSVPGAAHLGRFDYVIARHEPLGMRIDDFVATEIQTAQTTNTGRLVRALQDFMDGRPVTEMSYRFGLNMADIWKRAFTQILTEGLVLERWGHKIFWVVQEPIFRDLEARYRLGALPYNDSHATIFALYDLKRAGNSYELVQTRIMSSTADGLFDAFRTNLQVPPKRRFVEKLEKDLKETVRPSLELRL